MQIRMFAWTFNYFDDEIISMHVLLKIVTHRQSDETGSWTQAFQLLLSGSMDHGGTINATATGWSVSAFWLFSLWPWVGDIENCRHL